VVPVADMAAVFVGVKLTVWVGLAYKWDIGALGMKVEAVEIALEEDTTDALAARPLPLRSVCGHIEGRGLGSGSSMPTLDA
jgi:hypothetical protein